MSSKVVQLEFFKTENQQFQETVVKMMKSLFKKYDLILEREIERQKQIADLSKKYDAASEIIMNMNDRICRMSDQVIDDALRNI